MQRHCIGNSADFQLNNSTEITKSRMYLNSNEKLPNKSKMTSK